MPRCLQKEKEAYFVFALLLLFQVTQTNAICEDPLQSILDTLECIVSEDVACASNGYNPDEFVKIHNGVDTNTTIDAGGSFWSGAFSLSDVSFPSMDFMMNVADNQASIRYIEKVVMTDGSLFGLVPSAEYPFGQSYYQHEHAIVTVDDDCKIIKWDQYGDNLEQDAVTNATTEILCLIGFIPAQAPECEKEEIDEDSSSSNQRKSTLSLMILPALYLLIP